MFLGKEELHPQRINVAAQATLWSGAPGCVISVRMTLVRVSFITRVRVVYGLQRRTAPLLIGRCHVRVVMYQWIQWRKLEFCHFGTKTANYGAANKCVELIISMQMTYKTLSIFKANWEHQWIKTKRFWLEGPCWLYDGSRGEQLDVYDCSS